MQDEKTDQSGMLWHDDIDTRNLKIKSKTKIVFGPLECLPV
jgi:hypothetical protein